MKLTDPGEVSQDYMFLAMQVVALFIAIWIWGLHWIFQELASHFAKKKAAAVKKKTEKDKKEEKDQKPVYTLAQGLKLFSEGLLLGIKDKAFIEDLEGYAKDPKKVLGVYAKHKFPKV